jgi:hypothetical protein
MNNLKTFKSLESIICIPFKYKDDAAKSAFKSIKKNNDDLRDWHYPFSDETISITENVLFGDFKYVVFKRHMGLCSSETFPIIFTKDISHDYLSESIIILDEYPCEPISAGFVSISTYKINVFGRSETLDIDSIPKNDLKIISSFLSLIKS